MTYELYMEEKLPDGWSGKIPDHCISHFYGAGKHLKSYIYQSWYNMLVRCYLPITSNPSVKNYIFIKVYIRWVEGDGTKSGFLCFLEDMGERPVGCTLGRIGDVGHYTPDNVEWQTSKQQGETRKQKKRMRRAA